VCACVCVCVCVCVCSTKKETSECLPPTGRPNNTIKETTTNKDDCSANVELRCRQRGLKAATETVICCSSCHLLLQLVLMYLPLEHCHCPSKHCCLQEFTVIIYSTLLVNVIIYSTLLVTVMIYSTLLVTVKMYSGTFLFISLSTLPLDCPRNALAATLGSFLRSLSVC